MKRKRIEVVFVVALFAAALAFVACKNIEDGGEIQQPPAPEQGATGGSQGEGQPGGDNTGNEGESPDEGQNQPSAKTVVELLKEIIGENEYDAISAEVAAGNLTLTAEKIKAVGDIFPALEKDAESGKEAKDVENAAIRQNKEAFVAQAEGEVAVRFGPIYPDWYEKYPFLFDEEAAEKKYVVTYKANVKFTDEFNLSEITLPDNNGKGDFDNATLTNNGESISINVLNNIRGSYSPKLIFNKNNNIQKVLGIEGSKAVYELYTDYSGKLGNLQIKGDLASIPVNGKNISDNSSNYTLFNDNDTAKSSSDTSVKSLTIDAMLQMYDQLGIQKFLNMIISGTAEEATVKWVLTNIVFEGDMSKIKDRGNEDLTGIVYFKNKPYNNVDRNNVISGQEVKGLLKLDILEDVSYTTLGVSLSNNSSVLDVRGVDKNVIEGYNSGILAKNGYAHAIYFSKDFYKENISQDEINKLCDKFSNNQDARFLNAYLGENKVKGQNYGEASHGITSDNPRTLKDFEHFGNNNKFMDGKNVALDNKSCFSCVAKSFV